MKRRKQQIYEISEPQSHVMLLYGMDQIIAASNRAYDDYMRIHHEHPRPVEELKRWWPYATEIE